jgi:RND family efflux transporter MFP subunit
MRRGPKIFLWIVIAVAVVALFGATAVKRLKKEEVKTIESVQEAEGVPVDYVVVSSTEVGDWRKFVGVAEGSEQVNLFADYRTRVSAVHARVGDYVRNGTVIVSLDEYDPARFAVNLETSRAQYQTAQRDSARLEELFRSGAISQQELDHARAETDRARAAYSTARRAVELDSPISGVLTALYVVGGEYAESGEILATVASYRKIKIALDVSASQVSVLAKGQEVRIPLGDNPTDGGDGRYLQGSVASVSLSADPDSRLFRIDLEVDNPDGELKPGSLVAPRIKIASSGGGPAVPESALMSVQGGEAVYVVAGSGEDRRAELRKVSTGIGDGSLLAIESGLTEGDFVVVWGHRRLREGSKVKLHEDLTDDFFGPGAGKEGSR